jgi:hypothetical protein
MTAEPDRRNTGKARRRFIRPFPNKLHLLIACWNDTAASVLVELASIERLRQPRSSVGGNDQAVLANHDPRGGVESPAGSIGSVKELEAMALAKGHPADSRNGRQIWSTGRLGLS